MSEYTFSVNDLTITVHYSNEDIQHVFLPFLKQLSDMQENAGKRLIVFLAAAPGSGKSTFVSFLEHLSKTTEELTPIQGIGIDGFHYKQSYLDTHYLKSDPAVLLRTVKGSPDTFDVESLYKHIQEAKHTDNFWPVYSRKLHDPLEDQIRIQEPILLIEGNYLLYPHAPWKSLYELCDYSVYMHVDQHILKERLVQRKVSGGSSYEDALQHYEAVDRTNIELVIEEQLPYDLLFVFDRENHIVSDVTKAI